MLLQYLFISNLAERKIKWRWIIRGFFERSSTELSLAGAEFLFPLFPLLSSKYGRIQRESKREFFPGTKPANYRQHFVCEDNADWLNLLGSFSPREFKTSVASFHRSVLPLPLLHCTLHLLPVTIFLVVSFTSVNQHAR